MGEGVALQLPSFLKVHSRMQWTGREWLGLVGGHRTVLAPDLSRH